MNATTDILRGELERLFELKDMMRLSADLLGYEPEEVGGTAGKGAFARALVDLCAGEDALEALVDAIMLTKKGAAGESVQRALSAGGRRELEPGTELAGYKVVKKIGEGNYGIVYLGESASSNGEPREPRRVAIKVVARTHSRDRGAARRFMTVCRALRGVQVEGLSRVVEVGQLEDGRPWVAAEYVEGQTLATRISRLGAMHLNEAKPVVSSVLGALKALHELGIVHGDLKTENVFTVRSEEGGEPVGVLVDAGVDRLISRGVGLLAVSGTVKAIDPELARGNAPSQASDLYAAGAFLYELLSGRPPFVGQSPMDVVAQHLTREPEPPSAHAPRGWISKELDAVVLKALAKDPKDRYRTVAAMIDALEEIARAMTLASRPQKQDLDRAAFDEAANALRNNPEDEEIAALLELVVAPAEEWSKAIEVLSEIVDRVEDKGVKRVHLFRIARIHEAERSDPSAAEEAFRKVLELDPDDEVARVGIEELKRATGASEELVEILLEKVESEDSHAGRAAILREIAHIYEEKLDAEDQAFVAWVQALADEPTDQRTISEVERLATSQERWNEVITTLNETAGHLERNEAVPIYLLVGRWYGDKLQRPDFALQCYAQALKADPSSDGAFDGTIKLYRKAQSWKELSSILKRRAEATANPAAARDYRAEAAQVLWRKMGDRDKATSIFEHILADDPTHPMATEALETVYSEKEQWAELAKLLETRSHNERGEARVGTLVRMGEICEDRLDQLEKASVHYESAVAHDPENLNALKGLERIYARTGKYKELLLNLESQLTLSATPRQKISLLERIGGIYEEEFVDHERAAAAYAQVVEIEPAHDAANVALARLYRTLQRFDDLANTLERHAKGIEDDGRKTELLLAAAKVLHTDVGAPDRALAHCEAILEKHSDHGEALELLAKVQRKSGDAGAAVGATDKLAEAEKDPKKRAALWLRAGQLLEETGDKDGAVLRYKRALDAQERSPEAAAALRNIYASRGDAQGAVDLIKRELEFTEGGSTQAKLHAELGDLYRERLENPGDATKAYERALDLDPTCTTAAYGLSTLAFAAGDWPTAARHSEPLLARTSGMPTNMARDMSVLCGDAFRNMENYEKAQRAYTVAKTLAEDDLEVLERVADVTFRVGNANEAVEVYRDIKARFGAEMVAGERGRVLCRLGDSLRRAGKALEALKILEEAIELIPESSDPFTAIRLVHEERKDWAKVISTLERQLEHADDPQRFAILVTIGDTQLGKLNDTEKAVKSFVSALEVRPDDRNLLTKLMGVYSQAKDWSRLIEVILRIAELVDDPPQLAKYFNTAATIAHLELGRLDEACDYYEQALANDSTMGAAFDGLLGALEANKNYEGLSRAYRAQLERLKDADPARRVELHEKLAEVLQDKLDNVSEALEALEAAQELDPENRERAEKLAATYGSDPKRYFTKAVRAHTLLLTSSPYRVESYQALRGLYAALGREDETWCIAQALSVLNMADPDEIALYKNHRARTPATAQEFFTEELWFNHVVHPDLDPLLTGIFARVTPAVIATREQKHSDYGVASSDRKDPETDPAGMAQTLHYVSGVTQISLPDVYYRNQDTGGLSLMFTNPPSIGLGKGALAGGPSQALAFVAGRHLCCFRPGFYLRHLVPTGSGLRGWLLAAIKLVQPAFPVPKDLKASVNEALAALKEHLDAQARQELGGLVQKLLSASPSLDMKKWVAAVDITCDRVGFALANDLAIAAAVIKASPEDMAAVKQKDRLRELHLYSVSDPYLSLRHKLGIAIDGQA